MQSRTDIHLCHQTQGRPYIMNFAEKIKALRKQFKFSQEQLAEKLNVSRQAITKWETEGGLPDIENLMAIALLFSVSIDELLSAEKLTHGEQVFAYESVTEYDICRLCHFDIHAPGSSEVSIATAQNEKLRIRLASRIMESIENDYKVQIDEHRSCMDIDIHRMEQRNNTDGKEALYIEIILPSAFCEDVELSAATNILRLTNMGFPFEFDGKAGTVLLSEVSGHIALNCNMDMDIRAEQLPHTIEINQINASSKLHIPLGARYFTKVRGKSNIITFSENGKPAKYQGDVDAKNRIELAGMNAELLIDQREAAR